MRCPACALASLVHTADLGVVPALCGVTWQEPAAAVGSARGEIRLAHCPRCGHAVNVAFDPELIVYDGEYDNSLHHSPTFAQYATQLAKRLSAEYDLAGRTVLEPGCGKGDFLVELCAVAGATGLGYDASYQGPDRVGRVRFVRGFLTATGDGAEHAPEPDFIVSRHVLEHLDDPYRFLVQLRRLAGDRKVQGYIEVPNAGYDFATAGWDCIYPHVSYFNAASLTWMLHRAGFEVLDVGTAFDDIFLWAEVAANPSGTPVDRAIREDVAAEQVARLESFGQRYADTVAGWRTTIDTLSADGARVVLWGAGARGVAFLNAVDPGRRLAGVVDLNPGKWGRYLPVTGHRVRAPEEVAEIRPAVVVITNPAYRDEIAGTLAGLGVDAEVRAA